ncbi:hypothetical protein BDN72DRAFT_64542 [Pluteus cervinus]|uniref:Uncharacterized protein n=1 Tax=Pluteus cervinus TaxID=181527 RepID=A0ACD3ARZ5_9AGAR|nr:hypothetical protein BDN72DRAFT_64542 [Pluteus cervinus]
MSKLRNRNRHAPRSTRGTKAPNKSRGASSETLDTGPNTSTTAIPIASGRSVPKSSGSASIPDDPASSSPLRRSPRLAVLEKAGKVKKGLEDVAKDENFHNLEDDDLIADKVTGIVDTLKELEAAQEANDGKGIDTKAFSFSRVTNKEYPRFGAVLRTGVPLKKLALRVDDKIIKGFEKAWAGIRGEALRSLKDTLRFTAVSSEDRSRSLIDKEAGFVLRLTDPDPENLDSEADEFTGEGTNNGARADEDIHPEVDEGPNDPTSQLGGSVKGPEASFVFPEVSVDAKDTDGKKKTIRIDYGSYQTLLTGRLDLLMLTTEDTDYDLRTKILTRKSLSEVQSDLAWRSTSTETHFLIIEAKRQEADLATHMPQVVAQSLAL